jgi:hypothetical protein
MIRPASALQLSPSGTANGSRIHAPVVLHAQTASLGFGRALRMRRAGRRDMAVNLKHDNLYQQGTGPGRLPVRI